MHFDLNKRHGSHMGYYAGSNIFKSVLAFFSFFDLVLFLSSEVFLSNFLTYVLVWFCRGLGKFWHLKFKIGFNAK